MPTALRHCQNDRSHRHRWLPRLRTINWALLVVGLPVVGLLRLDLSLERWMQIGFIAVPVAVLASLTFCCIWAYRRRRRKILAAISLLYAAILIAAGTLAVPTVRRVRAIDAIEQSGGYVANSGGICVGPWQFSPPKWLRELGGKACCGNASQITLQGPGATDAVMDRFRLLSEVHTISLRHTMVTRAGLSKLHELGNVRSLFIESPHFTDADLAEVVQLRNLVNLTLSVSLLTDDALASLSRLRSLEYLVISAPLLGDDALAGVSTLPKLRTLGMGPSERITDQGLAHLRKLPKLQILSLVGLHVGDSGLDSLSQIPTLVNLQVSVCRFSDAGLRRLQRRAKSPRFILLSGTNISEQGFDRFRLALPNSRINSMPLPPGGPELPAERHP